MAHQHSCSEGRKVHEKKYFSKGFTVENDFPLSISVFYLSLCRLVDCESASKNKHQSVGTLEDSWFGVGGTENVNL